VDGVLNHMAHHRGQLTVYLRLNEEKNLQSFVCTRRQGITTRDGGIRAAARYRQSFYPPKLTLPLNRTGSPD